MNNTDYVTLTGQVIGVGPKVRNSREGTPPCRLNWRCEEAGKEGRCSHAWSPSSMAPEPKHCPKRFAGAASDEGGPEACGSSGGAGMAD
jgi:hypothetical protein